MKALMKDELFKAVNEAKLNLVYAINEEPQDKEKIKTLENIYKELEQQLKEFNS